MKTDVSIRFKTEAEYEEIKKTLLELGYTNDTEWNEEMFRLFKLNKRYLDYFVLIYQGVRFEIHNHNNDLKYYDSLEDFLL